MKIEKLFLYSLVFIILVVSQDTILFGTNSNLLFVDLMKYLYLSLPFVLVIAIAIKSKKISLNLLIISLLVISQVFLSAFLNFEPIANYIYKISIIITAYLFVEYVPRYKYLKAFDDIMFVLVTASLVMFSIQLIIPSVLKYLPTITNTTGLVFNTILLANSTDSLSHTLIRNWGIYREPGFFVIMILLSLCSNLFSYKKISKTRVVLLVLAIFTTFSTTGYIVFLSVVLAFIFTKYSHYRSKGLAMVILVLLILITLLIADPYGYISSVFSKFNDNSNSYGSFLARYASFAVNIIIFIENPLFGIGTYKTFEIYPVLASQMFGLRIQDNTNTMLINFASHGILYGLTMLIGLWNFSKSFFHITLGTTTLFVGLFLLFSGNLIIYNAVFYIIIFYGIQNGIKKDEVKFI